MEDLGFIRDKITRDFTEVKSLISEHKVAQKTMRMCDRRLKSINNKYKFLVNLIAIGSNDTLLVNAVKLLLKNAGFKEVKHFKDKRQKTKREDLQAWSDNDVFIIEVKGISRANPAYNDISQVLRYLAENKKRITDKNVYGLTIINHDNQKPISERNETFKDKEKENDAKNQEFGFISVIDLICLFRALKRDETTFEQFKSSLKQYGLITYGSKGRETSER